MKRLRAGALASLAAASAALLSFVHGVPLVILLAVATATADSGACLPVDPPKKRFQIRCIKLNLADTENTSPRRPRRGAAGRPGKARNLPGAWRYGCRATMHAELDDL